MTEVEITIPRLHAGQQKVLDGATRFNVLACGRRWGKTKFMAWLMLRDAIEGRKAGYFAPSYKVLLEVFNEVAGVLRPIADVNKSQKRIDTLTGGTIEFWTLEDQDAGRSRKYHKAYIDEAGLPRDLKAQWTEAIRPTLTDYKGGAWLVGTPKGMNFFWEAYGAGLDPLVPEWTSWQMPTITNPYIDMAEVEDAKRGLPERAFRQEYLAEFIEDAGGVFRGVRDRIRYPKDAPPSADGYVTLGVDLARVEDFTVICGVDDKGRQVYFERFNQINWERQVESIMAAANKFPGCLVRIDSTGVGDPIFEMIRKRHRRVEGFKFTSQTKEQIIDNLAILIESGRVELLDIDVQTTELLAYQYELTPSRNVKMGAPVGLHDDTVIALALAAWSLRPASPNRLESALDWL